MKNSPHRLAPLALALSLWSSRAWAQPAVPPAGPTSEARVHFDRGLALFTQGNFEGALAEFRRAYELSSRVSLLYNLGATYQALHRYPEAAGAIEEYLRRAENLPPGQREQVEQVLTQIRGFIAHVRVQVDPPDASVVLDDEPVSAARLAEDIPIGPGRHTISATAAHRAPARQIIEVASGDRSVVPLRLERLPDAAVIPARVSAPTIALRGVPAGATVELDGRAVSPAAPITVTAGPHRVAVRASGFDAWSGEVRAAEGAERVVSLHLAPMRGIRPEAFLITAVATGVFTAAGVAFGLLTLGEREEFSMYSVRSPEAEASSERGTTYRTVTNVMFTGAALSGIASVILLTQTRFGRGERSTVDIAFLPIGNGAVGSMQLRF